MSSQLKKDDSLKIISFTFLFQNVFKLDLGPQLSKILDTTIPLQIYLELPMTDNRGWTENLEIGIGQVDVTSSPGLLGGFMVTALSTIFHVKNAVSRTGGPSRPKTGPSTLRW